MQKATIKTQLGKPGRRPIDPEIRRFISNEDYKNKSQEPKARLPQGVLAHRIHGNLLLQYGGRKRVKIPKVSTIQKMLGKLPKEIEDIDKPWTVRSLSRFPISAAALPAVLRAWAPMRRATGRALTIREAQWIARLYVAAERWHFDYLVNIALMYAEDERLAPFPNHSTRLDEGSLDLSLFEALIGQEVDSEQAATILGHTEFDPGVRDRMEWGSHPELGEVVGIREGLRRQFMGDIGDRNERTSE
jgi:hypothetical protein